MDAIDRYFRTLRILLPTDQRDDIIRELLTEVQSQVEEKEAALGRRLEAAEQAAILGQYGHPLRTAARYRPQRYLIGPVVFPYYWIVLTVTIGLIAIGHVLGAAVVLTAGTSAAQIGQLLETAIATVLMAAAWITALGAVADVFLTRSGALEKWNPIAGSSLPLRQPRRRRPSAASASSLVVSVVLGVWWLTGLKFPYLLLGPAAAVLEWGPAMKRLFPVLVIGQVAMLAEQWVNFTRPEIPGLVRLTRFVWLMAGLVLIYLVATSDPQWMVWRADSATGARAAVVRFGGRDIPVIEFVNGICSIVFVVVAASSAWGVLKTFVRRPRRTPLTPHA